MKFPHIRHHYGNWSEPMEITIVNAFGSFGQTTTIPVVVQERTCSVCGVIDSRIIGEGKL
jgi:hypothetical protein